MRRFATTLAAAVALSVPLLATAPAASAADPVPVDVFFRGDGSVCVTYNNLTTACTSRIG